MARLCNELTIPDGYRQPETIAVDGELRPILHERYADFVKQRIRPPFGKSTAWLAK